jgi:hypothetical protein
LVGHEFFVYFFTVPYILLKLKEKKQMSEWLHSRDTILALLSKSSLTQPSPSSCSSSSLETGSTT